MAASFGQWGVPGSIRVGDKQAVLIMFPVTIVGFVIAADQIGSVTLDIWQAPLSAGQWPPTSHAASICPGSPPSLGGQAVNPGAPGADWTRLLQPGTGLVCVVTSIDTTLTNVMLALHGRR